MPKFSYGPAAKQRTLSLLVALLNYGNDELVVEDETALERLRSQLTLHWGSDRQLIVRTKVRNLATLMRLVPDGQSLSTVQIKEALHHLEHHVELLEDNRASRRGSDTWHFTLNLWYSRRDRAALLTRFDELWEQRRSVTAKRQAVQMSSVAEADPAADEEDWPLLCRQALDIAAHTALTTNALTAPDGLSFDLADIYVPLNLMARSVEANADETSTPEAIAPTQLWQQMQQQDVRRLAIVGEPGAGKTTLLQQMAYWVLEHTRDLPILVPLAEVGDRALEDYLLEDWLKMALGKRTVPPATQQALTEQIEQGRVWLLLDAIDEMGVSGSLALTALARQCLGWLRHARIVMTCRLSLWDSGKNALATVPTYQLRGYDSHRHQVETVIRRWFQASPEQGEQLCRELARAERKRLRSAIRNPLRLALLCRIGGQGQLPETRHQVYQQFVTALYDWKQDYFPTRLVERQHLNRVLAKLALTARTDATVQLPLARMTQTLALEDLPYLEQAMQLGWLTPIASTTGAKVYRFAHNAFQDYFTAQAIDHWQVFAQPQGQTLPIVAPDWQAVILLWLGREDISESAKTALMNHLITFDDGCGGFCSDRAWLLAGRALGEYPSFTAGDRIIQKLLQWRFNQGQSVAPVLVEGAKAALAESDHSRVVQALTELAQDPSQSPFDRWMAAYSLGRSYEPDSEVAIATLTELLQTSPNPHVTMNLARHLGILSPGHPLAISTLVDIIETTSQAKIQRKAAVRLAKIAPEHPLPLTTLEHILTTNPSPQQQRSTLAALKEIAPNHRLATAEDAQSLSTTQSRPPKAKSQGYQPDPQTRLATLVNRLDRADSMTSRLHLARQIGQLQPGHSAAIAVFMDYLKAPENLSLLKSVCDHLCNCVTLEQIPTLIPTVKSLYETAQATNQQPRRLAYFRLLWEWATELGYVPFYGYWHEQA
ncbi:MAG: HEAT repeat domain-containing protein [Cyanobacteria bacterium J06638_28]